MPELPELRAHAERLSDALGRATIERVELLAFTACKTVTPPLDAAVGQPVEHVALRGKHLLLVTPVLTYVVHLMHGGRLELGGSTAKRPRGGLVRWRLEGGHVLLLTEAGTERKAGVWAITGDPLTQPPLDDLGPDADAVDADDLAPRLRAAQARLHTALRDQRVVAGLGRRLANEVCHRARRSPFTATARLDADDVAAVAEALRAVLAESLEEERARGAFGRAADRTTAVHGRTGQACPVCGDVVREVAYRAYTVHYCAACQTAGKVLADNTYSRLGILREPGGST